MRERKKEDKQRSSDLRDSRCRVTRCGSLAPTDQQRDFRSQSAKKCKEVKRKGKRSESFRIEMTPVYMSPASKKPRETFVSREEGERKRTKREGREGGIVIQSEDSRLRVLAGVCVTAKVRLHEGKDVEGEANFSCIASNRC